jgi:hypothetical protein
MMNSRMMILFAILPAAICMSMPSPPAMAEEHLKAPATTSAIAPAEEEDSPAVEAAEITGIVTFILVAATVLSAAARKINPRVLFKLHKILGYVALVSAVVHGTIVLTML